MVQTGTEQVAVVQYRHHGTEGSKVPAWPTMTIKEAAEYSGYHPEYLRRLCRQGKIDHTRAGNVYLVKTKSLLDYIENLDPADGRTGAKGS